MLTSVAALNPAQRFKSSICLSFKRTAAATTIQHAIQSRTNNHLKNDYRYDKRYNFLRIDVKCHSTRSSNQLEHDQRKGSINSNYQQYDTKSLRLQEPISPLVSRQLEIDPPLPEYTDEKRGLNIKIVDTVEKAREVLAIMYAQHARNPRTVWACDTEVADIDLSLVGKYASRISFEFFAVFSR